MQTGEMERDTRRPEKRKGESKQEKQWQGRAKKERRATTKGKKKVKRQSSECCTDDNHKVGRREDKQDEERTKARLRGGRVVDRNRS